MHICMRREQSIWLIIFTREKNGKILTWHTCDTFFLPKQMYLIRFNIEVTNFIFTQEWDYSDVLTCQMHRTEFFFNRHRRKVCELLQRWKNKIMRVLLCWGPIIKLSMSPLLSFHLGSKTLHFWWLWFFTVHACFQKITVKKRGTLF